MVYTKYYVGKTNLSDLEVKYFVIEKERKYGIALEPVSYTHLDVYKRQAMILLAFFMKNHLEV